MSSCLRLRSLQACSQHIRRKRSQAFLIPSSRKDDITSLAGEGVLTPSDDLVGPSSYTLSPQAFLFPSSVRLDARRWLGSPFEMMGRGIPNNIKDEFLSLRPAFFCPVAERGDEESGRRPVPGLEGPEVPPFPGKTQMSSFLPHECRATPSPWLAFFFLLLFAKAWNDCRADAITR